MTAPALSVSPSAARSRARKTAGNLAARLAAALALWRQRRRLAVLDAHLLDDIGLTRGEALRESRRPVWDAPDHWLR